MKKCRKVIRLSDYDYSQAGGYFVTICTYNRECILGQVINGETISLPLGEKAKEFWQEIPKHFENVQLDEFMVMPNHIHGIIIIKDETETRRGEVSSPEYDKNGGVTPPLQRPTLGQIVAYYKYQTTKLINQIRNIPGSSVWQRNYYEHIIRNENELYRIREYIQNNPLKWELDRENPLSVNFNLEHSLYWRGIYEGEQTRKGFLR